MVGGMVILAGGAVAYKLSKKDADKIEKKTGTSVEELSEEDLVAAMKELGIQSVELTDEDKAVIQKETGSAPSSPTQPANATALPDAETPASEESSYLEELQQLAKLHEQGILSDEEFAAKKAQILGS
jgi:hypothetical protein